MNSCFCLLLEAEWLWRLWNCNCTRYVCMQEALHCAIWSMYVDMTHVYMNRHMAEESQERSGSCVVCWGQPLIGTIMPCRYQGIDSVLSR